jgi:hypothetical protein
MRAASVVCLRASTVNVELIATQPSHLTRIWPKLVARCWSLPCELHLASRKRLAPAVSKPRTENFHEVRESSFIWRNLVG